MDLSFNEGDHFKTFEDFQSKLEKRGTTMNEKWIKGKSAHSVKSTNDGLKGSFRWPERLCYTSVNFICKHYGHFKSRGQSRESTSRKQGCPAIIRLRSDRTTLTLKIVEVNLQHDHGLATKSDGIYPDDRKLSPEQEAEVSIDDVLRTHNIQMISKDVHNLRTKMQSEKAGGLSLEDQVWLELQKMVESDEGAHFSAFAQDGTISTIFFQTSHMRKLLQTYPEVLFVDTTYCLNAYKYPVVVFMVVDGDNKGHCVGYAIIRDEKLVTFAILFQEFVRKNEFLQPNLKTVVVDKDASEIGAIKLAMSDAKILFCRFHVRKAINSNVDSLCSKRERENVKEIVRKLVWVDKEDKFMEAYSLLEEGSEFKDYFDRNWMVIRDHWANYMTKHITTWGNKTTNFVERHNRALKTVGSSKLGLADFIAELLIFHKREQALARRRVLTLNSTTKVYRPEYEAAEPLLARANKFLLPHACKSLKAQLDILHKKTTIFDSGVLYEINSDNIVLGEHPIADGKCQCGYFNDKELPCWHLLGYQQAMSIDVLAGIHDRFRKTTLMGALEMDIESMPSASGVVIIPRQKQKKTDLQKRQMLVEISRELVSVGVMCGQEDFDKRVEFLNL